MKEDRPEQAILEQLRSTKDAPSDFAMLVEENSRFWRPIHYYKKLPHGAKMETVRFLKMRSSPGYQVHALTFEDNVGLMWEIFCRIAQDGHGQWSVGSCCGGGGNAIRSYPQRLSPWIILSADWENYFYAGGSVIDPSRIGITRVRLLFEKGLSLEDAVQHQRVLFITNQIVQKLQQVEFYNQANDIIYTTSHFSLL